MIWLILLVLKIVFKKGSSIARKVLKNNEESKIPNIKVLKDLDFLSLESSIHINLELSLPLIINCIRIQISSGKITLLIIP